MQLRRSLPLIYVGDYSGVGSLAGGALAPAEWASDTYGTPGATAGNTTFAGYTIPPGGSVGSFFYGDTRGRIFREDESGEVAFSGVSLIVPAHYFYGDPGGAVDEGNQLVRLWSYIVSEDSDWMLRVWPGGEYAYVPDGSLNHPLGGTPAGFANHAEVGLIDTVAASRDEVMAEYHGVLRRVRKQPLSVHPHSVEGVPNAGRGHTFEFIFFDPVNAEFLGFGGVRGPGSTSRPLYTVLEVL